MKAYISVDLDSPELSQVVESWERVSMFGGPHGRVSSGGDGVHIVNKLVLPETVYVNESARKFAGDDLFRIKCDKIDVLHSNQVLYDSKTILKAGSWTDNLAKLITELLK